MKSPLFIYIAILITLGSCKKETQKPPISVAGITDTCHCDPLPLPDITMGCPSCYTDFDETYFTSPVINPNNADEVIYIDGIYPHSRVMLYNLATKEKRVLINDNVSSSFSWSKKDWILFQRSSDFNLYKIRSNGDDLTQLTNNGKWFHGRWNFEGDKFIVYQKHNSISKSFIMNENGIVIDSLTNWQHSNGFWSHPQYYLGGSAKEIIVMDVENKEVIKNIKFNTDISLLGWSSLNEFLYRSGTKLYNYNLSSSETKLVKCECNKAYTSLTFSSDFTKLLFVKVENSVEVNDRIFEDSKLVLMNKDGSNEIEIVP